MSDLSELMRQAIRSELSNVHTSMPARVESYDHAEQRASVTPLIKKAYRDGQVESMPVIERVPVMFPRGDNFSMTWPMKPGDNVLLVFSERSLENWLSKGGEQEPGDTRQFSLTDAIAIPGVMPFQRSGGLGGLGDLFGLADSPVAEDAAADGMRGVLEEVLPSVGSAMNTLQAVATGLGEEAPDLAALLEGMNGAITVLTSATQTLGGVVPDIRKRTNMIAGVMPMFTGTVASLRGISQTLAIAAEDLDGIATAIGITKNLGNIAQGITNAVDALGAGTAVLDKVFHGLGGVGDLVGFLGSSLSTTSSDVEMQYNGFRLVINQDGRYAIGNDFDEVMIILQTLIGALCASICIPGAPLSEVPVYIALFHRLLTLRGSLNSLLPFAAEVLPDFLERLGPEPLDVIDFEEELD